MKSAMKKKERMATKTLYVGSRTRIRGNHADFSISLPEGITLRGARLFVDAIRTTDTFPTVSTRNRYAYFRGAADSLWAYTLTPGAYTGASFAAQLAAVSGRSCTYNSGSNSIQLTNSTGTSIIFSDDELSQFPASAFPADASPQDPKSINDILGGDAVVSGTSTTFPFVTMAPLQDLYLTSHHLMVHDSYMPRGQRHALAKLSLTGGYGTVVQGSSPSDCWYNLGEHITLKEVDFQVRDYKGSIVPLLAPISFQLIFEC